MSITSSDYSRKLRNLYFACFAVAIIWVGLVLAAAARATEPSILLTALLVIFPAFDAGAVLWQMRADPAGRGSWAVQKAAIALSSVVAIALGIASSISLPAAVALWGVWAIASGVPQLLTAIRNRGAGGQIAQVLSGGISVLAGGGFLYQGLLGRAMMAGVAGYATLGAVFFLVSAIVLSAKLRKVSV